MNKSMLERLDVPLDPGLDAEARQRAGDIMGDCGVGADPTHLLRRDREARRVADAVVEGADILWEKMVTFDVHSDSTVSQNATGKAWIEGQLRQ